MVLEDETSPEMTSFFHHWGFAKYGAKKGCPQCKDLFNKGSSLQKHCSTCPSITGEQYSSSSDESVVHGAEVADLLGQSGNHDDYFPVDYNIDFSGYSFVDDNGEIDSVTVGHDASNTHDAKSAKHAKQNESSHSVTVKHNESSKSVSRIVLEKLPHSNLLDLVDNMYTSAFALAHLGSLGLPKPFPKSSYEPLVEKMDSFIIGGFINEETGTYLRKLLNIEQSLKVCFFLPILYFVP